MSKREHLTTRTNNNISDKTNYNLIGTDLSLTEALEILKENGITISKPTFLKLCNSKRNAKISNVDIKRNGTRYFVNKEDLDKFISSYQEFVSKINDVYIPINKYASENKISRRTVERLINKGAVKSCFYNKKTYINMED